MSTRPLIGRRQFLVVSSTCAVAAAAVGPKLFAGETSQPKRLVVGFASFGDDPAVMPAAAIPSGDGGFIGRGARITTAGAIAASNVPSERRAVELLAHYSYQDGAHRRVAPFVAWASSRVTGSHGNGVGFTVPVDEVQKIVLTVGVARDERVKKGAADSTSVPVTLSLADGDGAVRLVRGYYVIVPLFDADAEPAWTNWAIGTSNSRPALVDREGNVAPFEHFVLKIDYAA